MTPSAKQSDWVNIELNRAKRSGKRIFPVLADGDEDSAVPLVLDLTQFVDIRTDYAGAVHGKLIPALRKHLGVAAAATNRETKPPMWTELGIEWITIPAGEFIMGSDKKKDKQARQRNAAAQVEPARVPDRQIPDHEWAVQRVRASHQPPRAGLIGKMGASRRARSGIRW